MSYPSFRKSVFLFILLGFFFSSGYTQANDTERTIRLNNPSNRTIIEINLPDTVSRINTTKKSLLIFFALPNGNSIDWTKGKKMNPGDNWHYDIQHIAAQTRYLRNIMTDWNVIVVYMTNEVQSWPSWKKAQTNGPVEIKRIVDSIMEMFAPWHPEVMLSSHSGGGSFIFGYLDAAKKIPDKITRIAFIDSDYEYEDSLHTYKLVQWLKSSKKHHLNVLAYNDSIVTYNGRPLVSPMGGTWYRTKLLQKKLNDHFRFKMEADTCLIHYKELLNKIDIYMKINNEGKIYHTEQVVRNGFIHTVISDTRYAKKSGYQYWGKRVYEAFIRP